MRTKVDIINLAYARLRLAPINDLVSGGLTVTSVSNIYDTLYPAVLSSRNWRFATTIATLNRLVTVPPIAEWMYQFQLPADHLTTRRVIPNELFEVYQDKIYSNQQYLQLEYIYQVLEGYLPVYFVNYFSFELASNICFIFNEKSDMQARLDAGAAKWLNLASFIDSQARNNTAQIDSPFISVRG